MNAYFYLSPFGDGWRNLAADEYFLDHLRSDDVMLYLYVNERAVIIGRNQNPWLECDLDRLEKDGVQLVRRCTGGGAVYHDTGNLNFSFITGEAGYDLDRQMQIVLSAVRSFGIDAELNGRNDMTAGGRKFSGSAFGARRGMKQHHGTLLVNADLTVMPRYLTVSREKLEAKGIRSVRSRVINLAELNPAVSVPALAAALRAEFEKLFGPARDFTPDDSALESIGGYYARHASWEWRMGKSPDFNWTAQRRFAWGEVRLFLSVRDGVVVGAELYTDSLDPDIAEKARCALTGARFDAAGLASRLAGGGPELAELGAYLADTGL